MEYLEYLLWGYLVGWPIYICLNHEQEKQRVLAQPEKRIAVYRSTMIQLWQPVFILSVLVYQDHISLFDIGLRWHWGLANQIGVIGLVLICGYFLHALNQFSKNAENQQAMRTQLAPVLWFMPTTTVESRYFIFGISITAGICEELLYRGYLIQLLADGMPIYGAVILSSIAFGLGHIYQGPINVIRTTVMGIVMALIYLATDSIIVPMILHALLDMYGGELAYLTLRPQAQELISKNA
jgi:uncharacterized protein